MKFNFFKKAVGLALLLLAIVNVAMAQNNDPEAIERARKSIKKDLSDKALRLARQQAKDYDKQGYYVAPGSLPMDKQLEMAYIRQYEEDQNGYPRYITGAGDALAGTKIAARNQAIEAAKIELAGQIESTVVGLIENSIANNQLNQEEAASLTKTVTATKNIITQKLGRVIILFEAYKDGGKNVAATMRIAYNQELALESTKATLREQLEKEANDLHKKSDNVLKLN